jgi:hypothetical protein
MNNNVIQFPIKQKVDDVGYRINLYTEEEIYIVLLCLNMTEKIDSTKKYVTTDLRHLDPVLVMTRMYESLDSTLLSIKAKEHIKRIVNSIEVISISSLSN